MAEDFGYFTPDSPAGAPAQPGAIGQWSTIGTATPPPPVPNPIYPPPAGWVPGPPPTRTSKRRAIIIVVSLVGGLILLVVAAILLFFHEANGAKTSASSYLTALESHQYDTAYDSLCPSDRAALSETQFVAREEADGLESFHITGVRVFSSTSDGTTAVVTYSRVATDNAPFGFVDLTKAGGHWSVCHTLS